MVMQIKCKFNWLVLMTATMVVGCSSLPTTGPSAKKVESLSQVS